MADKPRNFDEEHQLDKRRAVSFILGGKTLHARPIIHPSVFLARKEGESYIDRAVRIIRGCLIDDDKAAFQELIDDPEVRITADQVDDVAAWLLSEASGRPTKSRPSSGNGVARTGNGSKENSSAANSTGKK